MKKNIKYLYCGNILPMQLVNELKLSVAGKKYEIHLIESLNKIWNENLDIVSIAKVGGNNKNIEKFNYLFGTKKFKHLSVTNIPVVRDIEKFFKLLCFSILWAYKNKKFRKRIIVLNSSFSVSAVSILMKIFFKSKIYSITIDTPYPNIKSKFYLYTRYIILKHKIGHYLLRFFNGIMILNKSVIKTLRLKIPYLVTKIGYNDILYNDNSIVNKNSLKKKIIYAGTLIDYNGIIELLDGFIMLDKNIFELHIYGDGDGELKLKVMDYCNCNKNIFYHGIINNEILLKRLTEADLLINPRITLNGVNDFGFPSKLIEYILSGVPVLTTDFGSLPDEYKDFLNFIDTETPSGIKKAIVDVFLNKESVLTDKCIKGVEYVKKNNHWDSIAKEIDVFIKNN